MKRSVLWISALVVVAVVIGVVVWTSRKPAAQEVSPAAAAPTGAAAAKMPPNSMPKPGEVLLVEYSDFQCPSCAAMFPLVRDIHREYEGRIQFVYRYFPLKQIHMNAERSAWAAEAAAQQGKFWEMSDLLFKNQPAWSALPNPMPAFQQYARTLGLDLNKFNADFDGFIVRSKVENDYRLGMQDGVHLTPTLFLNGRDIRPATYLQFRSMINEALAQTQAKNQ